MDEWTSVVIRGERGDEHNLSVRCEVTGPVTTETAAGLVATLLRVCSGRIGAQETKEALDWCVQHQEEYMIRDPEEEKHERTEEDGTHHPGRL